MVCFKTLKTISEAEMNISNPKTTISELEMTVFEL